MIFPGLSIPRYFIFDADSQLIGKGEKEKEAKNRNHTYLCLASAPVEDFPETQVHQTWAVFKENLESILRHELGNETFQSIRGQVASELGYDDLDQVGKNIEGAGRLIPRGDRGSDSSYLVQSGKESALEWRILWPTDTVVQEQLQRFLGDTLELAKIPVCCLNPVVNYGGTKVWYLPASVRQAQRGPAHR